MSKLLQVIARRIRLAVHFHDPIECWCELTADDAPAVRFGCVYCAAEKGQPHQGWCSRAEVAR